MAEKRPGPEAAYIEKKQVDFLQNAVKAQPEAPHAHANRGILPWLAPVIVLGAWIFIQVTFNLSSLVAFVNQIGILNGLAAWTGSTPQQMNWFTVAQSTLGGTLSPQGQAGLQVLNSAGLFAQDLVISLLWQIGAALLYCGALFLVWNRAEDIYVFLSK